MNRSSSNRRRPSPAPRLESVRQALADPAGVELLAQRFRALGDPSRSRLVLALSVSELCVSDLAAVLGASLSATSHQLRILRDLDLVRARRRGRSHVYALNEEAFGFCAPRTCRAWQSALDPRPAAPRRT